MNSPTHTKFSQDAQPAALGVSQGTLAQRLCARVLASVHSVDNEATISTVSRWEYDESTLVRVRGRVQPIALLHTLRDSFPLARVSVVENVIDGSNEAQLLVPSMLEQELIASSMATNTTLVVWMNRLIKALLLFALVSFAIFVTALASQ